MADNSASQPARKVEYRTVLQPAAAKLDLPALVHAHHAVVYRYACRLSRCPVEAEDLTQQAYLIAQTKLEQVREPEHARAWLLAIVRSCFLKSVRRSRPIAAQNADLEINHVPDRAPPRDGIDGEALHAALAELPDAFRLVLLMFYFEELSYHEIATQLDLPIGTVMSRLARAKSRLRRALAPAASEPQRPAPRRSAMHVPRRNTVPLT